MNAINQEDTMQFFLKDKEETELFATIFARYLRLGDVVLLKGSLGAGKTACARAIIHALSNHKPDVTSPTFTIMQSYDVTLENNNITCWHIDLYRLESPEELLELGIDEILLSGLLLIEWPERLAGSLPLDYILCELTYCSENEGRIAKLIFEGATRKQASACMQALSAMKYSATA